MFLKLPLIYPPFPHTSPTPLPSEGGRSRKMSQCPHCFVGQCQRHKLQDHGKREMLLKAKMVDPKAAQRRLYESIVTKQLDKLEAAARAASTTDQVSENQPSRSGSPRCVCVLALVAVVAPVSSVPVRSVSPD